MCHPCRYAIISHQELVHLNSNPFMKLTKVLNPITLNATLPWNFPVTHFPALFCFLLNIYGHTFVKVFTISQLILSIFQPFCFTVMLFPDAPNITQKTFTFFIIWYIIWSYPTSIVFCLHLLMKIKDSILSELFNSLPISSYFRTSCKHHSFQPFSFHSVPFI